MRSRSLLTFSALIFCTVALLLSGCKPLPPSKPASEWTPQEASGAEVFAHACARCHYPTTAHSLHGPGLQAITKVKSLPSGAPPTDERITDRIIHGYGTMPATHLTDEQLQNLLAYLHTL